MFLLLSLLLSGRAGTCALPVLLSRCPEALTQVPSFDVTTTASTCACTGRSLWDILRSCLATTFACTWTSAHPNIPFLSESKASTTRWRVYLMLVSLIAPEIMILWACKQLQGALVIMKTVNCSYKEVLERDWGDPDAETKAVSQDADGAGKTTKASKQKKRDNSPLWTLTHAQYLQMGGYRLQCLTSEEKKIPSRYGRVTKAMFAGGERDVWELPLSFETMRAAFNKGYIDIPFIQKDEILEKSGKDGPSKAMAMLQLTWFIIQIAARMRQSLAVTELELTTAALASFNIAMYISWWSKPSDILRPTIIATKGLQDQDRKWKHNVLLPSSPPETTQPADEAHYSSLPPDPKMHYVINHIGDEERVNLAIYCWYEFTGALRGSFIFIVYSPAILVTGLFGLASGLKKRIRGIWAGPSHHNSASDHKSTSDHHSATGDSHSRSPSKAPEISSCTTFIKKVRKTASTIWRTIAHLFLALIYYPILAISVSGRNLQPKPGNQRKTGSGKIHEPVTAQDVMDMTAIQLIFNKHALLFVMNMFFFCEDVPSAPFTCLSALSGAIFGIIHCLAWNFEFPSLVEQILWRTCSSVIAGLCVCIMAVALAYIINQICHEVSSSGIKEEAADRLESPLEYECTSSEDQSKLTASGSANKPPASNSPGDDRSLNSIEIACGVFTICFVSARISLISLSIIGLRALPASAFEIVQWPEYIPHI